MTGNQQRVVKCTYLTSTKLQVMTGDISTSIISITDEHNRCVNSSGNLVALNINNLEAFEYRVHHHCVLFLQSSSE